MGSSFRSNTSFPTNCLKSARSFSSCLILAALLYVAFARFATATDRLSFAAVTVSIAAFLAFCLYCKIVPARVASYLAGPLAFLTLLVTGSILTSRSLASLRPFTELCFTALVVLRL